MDVIKSYYIYTALTQSRFIRVVNILFITQILNFNILEYSSLQSVFLISQFLMEMPSGIFADMFKKKMVLLGGLILLAVSPLMVVFSRLVSPDINYILIFISFAFEGIGNALLSGTDDALFFECLKMQKKDREYVKVRGNVQLISSVAIGVSTVIGGILYSIYTFIPYILQTLVIIMVICLVFTLPNVGFIKKSVYKNTAKNIYNTFHSLVSDRSILFVFMFTVVVVSVINAVFTILPSYISHLDYSSYEVGIVFMFYSLVGGVVATQAYRLSKTSFLNIILIFSVFSLVSLMFQILNNSFLYIVGMCFIYVLVDVLDPIVMEILQLWVDDSSRATFLSSLSLSINLATIIMNPIIGALVINNGTKKMTEYISILIIIFTGILYIIFFEKKKKL